jgi:hypothetical protein
MMILSARSPSRLGKSLFSSIPADVHSRQIAYGTSLFFALQASESLLIKILAVGSAIGAAFLFALFIAENWTDPHWETVAFDHFRATVGLPTAAAASFTVAALFRTTEGQIKFEALTLKFEGASGPIVMWVLCFLAITLSIKMLW